MRRVSCLIFAGLMWVFPAQADLSITGCDRLAANPPDPDRVTTGVPRNDVDIPAAIAACRLAVESHPEVARLSYQLGRALFYDGQAALALESFSRAVDQNYRQAKFLLGLIMTRGYDDVPDDVCRVEQLWRAAALQNHSNAQVSYVQFALDGHFDSCPERASTQDLAAFLDAAAPQLDYVGGLLIANLRRDLED